MVEFWALHFSSFGVPIITSSLGGVNLRARRGC